MIKSIRLNSKQYGKLHLGKLWVLFLLIKVIKVIDRRSLRGQKELKWENLKSKVINFRNPVFYDRKDYIAASESNGKRRINNH